MDDPFGHSVELLDDLVIRSQELNDLYMQCIDQNPGARVKKHADADKVDNLLQALARFYLAQTRAVDAVATYVSGVYDSTDGDDF